MAKHTVICTYRVKADADDRFLDLLRRHWPTLHELGVVTDEPARLLRRVGDGPPTFVEIFTWAEQGFERAREHPDVLAIWEPMDQLCEARDGRPGMEFPHFEAISRTEP